MQYNNVRESLETQGKTPPINHHAIKTALHIYVILPTPWQFAFIDLYHCNNKFLLHLSFANCLSKGLYTIPLKGCTITCLFIAPFSDVSGCFQYLGIREKCLFDL